MFHLEDGLWFDRLDDGSVRIVKTNGLAPDDADVDIEFDVTTDAYGWASVVASVCARDESGQTHAEALRFHGAE